MPELYILRHGIAEPRKQGSDDSQRALTKEGREKLGLVLARARAAKVAPAVILTSPYVRAAETAGLAQKALAPKAKVVPTDALVPGSSPDAVWNEVRKHKGPVLLAGHEPLLGETISFLLGANGAVVDLKKGALACIEVDPKDEQPKGMLVWLMTPKSCQADSGA